jgi:Raf kinase inhibitor-like YbhB/YbcL family protein
MAPRTILSKFTILLTAAAVSAIAQDKGKQTKAPAGPGMTLTTTAFADGAEIPPKYTQSDPNLVSPRLQWTNVPPGTVTFLLHMHDPDVALQKSLNDQLHWMVLNIPGTARELPENVPLNAKLPDGSIQLKNGGGVVGYRGPGAGAAGPHHHYTWELYALDTKLDLDENATRPDVMKAIEGHILAKAVLVGRFHR